LSYQRDILGDKALKALMVGGVGGDQLSLFPGNVAGDGFAVLTALEIVVGAIGTLADNAELAGFHVLDLGYLLEQRLRRRCLIHAQSIYIYIYYDNEKPLIS